MGIHGACGFNKNIFYPMILHFTERMRVCKLLGWKKRVESAWYKYCYFKYIFSKPLSGMFSLSGEDIKTDGFSLETCRNVISLMDVSF